MDSYVSKPIRPEELFKEIYAYAQPPGPQRSSAALIKETSPGLPVEVAAAEPR
jgi:hypothetical protein